MNYSTLLHFLFILVLFLACSKSEVDQEQRFNCVQIDTSTPFFSEELADNLLTHMIWVSADNQLFDQVDAINFLSLNRFKKFNQDEGLFSYSTTGITSKSKIIEKLIIGNTNVPSLEAHNSTYVFNNAYDTIINSNNQPYDRLAFTTFPDVAFQLRIDDNTCYQGTFPALRSLESSTKELNHPTLSIAKGGTIEWNSSEALPNSFVSIFIEHHSSEVDNPIQAVKVFKTADTGIFEIQPAMLEGLKSGDWLGIYIRRDAFVQQDNLLLRSSETQYWNSVPVYE